MHLLSHFCSFAYVTCHLQLKCCLWSYDNDVMTYVCDLMTMSMWSYDCLCSYVCDIIHVYFEM
jgi:hypothetical protein